MYKNLQMNNNLWGMMKLFVSAAKGKIPSGADIFKKDAQKSITSGVTGALFGPF